MVNELASEDTGAEPETMGILAEMRHGLRHLLIRLGLKQPSFADKVEAYRRGTAEERRARRQAQRCVEGIEQARARLQRMAGRISEGGVETSVKFWPIAYRVGTNRKDRKFGFAELRGVIVLSARMVAGRQTTSLPITVTSTRDEVTIQPSFAVLQASGQQNTVVDLFLEVSHMSGDHDERVFCEEFENALAQAVASGRLAV
jgi:hypothetical protein